MVRYSRKLFFFVNYLARHREIGKIENFDKTITVTLNELTQTNDCNLPPKIFFYEAGFLTIKKVIDNMAELEMPNGEVKNAMAQIYEILITKSGECPFETNRKIMSALRKPDFKELVTHLNALYSEIAYDHNPLTMESHVRMVMQMFLIGRGYFPVAEKMGIEGRSDLDFAVDGMHWVLEFKFARAGDDKDKMLKDAIRQVKERKYGEFKREARQIRGVLVFDGDEHQFTHSAEVV